MTFSAYIRALILYTEDKPLVLRRQCELLSIWNYNYSVDEAGDYLLEIEANSPPQQ